MTVSHQDVLLPHHRRPAVILHRVASGQGTAPRQSRPSRWVRAVVSRSIVAIAVLTAVLGSIGASPRPRPAPARARFAAGRVEGTVVISKSLSAHRPRFRIYAGDGAALMPPAGDTVDERRNVVVYLVPTTAAASDADAGSVADHATVRQREERFAPHVVAVRRGATVDFPNEDGVFHNVFSLSSAKEFDLGRYPRG